MILTLNIETASDESCPKDLLPKPEDYPEYKKLETRQQHALEDAGKLSLTPLTGKVICVAFKEDDKESLLLGGNETMMIRGAFHLINKCTRLVTFNGKQFDLPFLIISATRINIPMPAHILRMLGKYENDRHTDIRNILTNHQQFGRGTLGQWASRFGINPPYGDGSQIAGWYLDNDWKQIGKHSISNVQATYEIYQRIAEYI